MRIFKPCVRQGTVGAVALSMSGRDAGIYCIITECVGGYAYIADGRTRLVQKPKKKKQRQNQKKRKQYIPQSKRMTSLPRYVKKLPV